MGSYKGGGLFHRDGAGDSHYEVVERDGDLRIVRQPWIESFSTDLWERATGLFDSALSARRG